MIRARKTPLPLIVTAFVLIALLLLPAWPAAARNGGEDDGGGSGGGGNGSLKLRVNPAIGVPGGTVAVVLRTYAARPIRQGQIGLRVRRRAPAAPRGAAAAAQAGGVRVAAADATQPARPVTLLGATVYSLRGDSVSRVALGAQTGLQSVQLDFSSVSGTINAADGPLAVLRLRLDPAVVPGQEFDLELDPVQTSLVDAAGNPITLQPIASTLTVRAPGAPFAVEAEGDTVAPGETAELGFSTFEPFPSAGGRIALRYAPRLAAGPPVVTMDPRYGKASFTVDSSTPGLLVVAFQSPDRTLNTVPGRLVGISLPVRAGAAVGARSALILDPQGTWLLTRTGRKVRLAIESGELLVR